MGFAPLNTLIQRCERTHIVENVRYVLFSAGGFRKELLEHAGENKITLVDSETLMGLKDAPNIFR